MSSGHKFFNCRQLVKHYSPKMLPTTDVYKIRLACKVELEDKSENPTNPAESAVLKNTIVSDLKIKQRMLFKTYISLSENL